MRTRLAVLCCLALCAAFLAPVDRAAAGTVPGGVIEFPTDDLTVADPAQLTGRRMALPSPDCAVARSICDDIALINTLDGFDLDPRLQIRLSSPPEGDLDALFSDDVLYLEPAAGGARIGVNRLVFDPSTRTLTARPAIQLTESTTYRLVYADQDVTFTTMAATAGLAAMRRQLDDGSAYDAAGIDEDARRISFTQGDLRTTFPAPSVVAINRYNEVVPGGDLSSELVINTALLNAGTYGFGSLTVPSWLDADSTIASAPTGGNGPQARGAEEIGVTVILPAGPRPEGGWPVALFGPGITRSKYDIYLVADTNAARGIATVSFDPVGHAFGPRSEVGVQTLTAAEEVRFSGFGRGRDHNNDGVITNQEGVQAPTQPHPKASIGLRDGLRQTAADAMSIIRAIGMGVDVDGDGEVDLRPDGVAFYALSLGGIYGSMLMGVETRSEVAVLNVPGGPIADIARQSPAFRGLIADELRNRVPAQLNSGRAQFTEDVPLHLDAAVVDPAPGALDIQETLARVNWLSRSGSPEAFAPRILRDPLDDAPAKRVVYQFAFGDQVVPNPTSATLARAFDDFDHVSYYRNDRSPSATQDPHGVLADPTIFGRTPAQLQAAEWMESDGHSYLPLDPVTWETPITSRDDLERLNIDEDLYGPDLPAPRRELVRVSGPNRIATAAAISTETTETSDVVVLARADDYADALAGGPLAVSLDAPLLLTDRAGLSPEASAEITRLGSSDAVLLGGEVALSAQVVADLEAAGLTVRRVSGPNRFATAAEVADELGYSSEIFVTEGANDDPHRGWPDALSASAAAAALGQPILLVTRDVLPAETAAALDARVGATVVGGTAAVSDAVADAVAARSREVRRVAGPDRYATSAAMAGEAYRRGLDPTATWLATGRDFADGLVAGAAAGRDSGMLLLVDREALAASLPSREFLADHAGAVDRLRLSGGTAAISPAVEAELEALLG